LGIEAQRDAITRFMAAEGLELIGELYHVLLTVTHWDSPTRG
jgi:hypothetical protein